MQTMYASLYFNCTIQELKYKFSRIEALQPLYFNCTIQELKFAGVRLRPVCVSNFNCTIQELKYGWRCRCNVVRVISIAPYRN